MKEAGAQGGTPPTPRVLTPAFNPLRRQRPSPATPLAAPGCRWAGLKLSCTALPAPNARAFRLLALADAPTLPLPIASAMLDLPRRGAEQILEELVDAHLPTCPRQGSYGFHDLPRLFGRERAAATETAQERLAALCRGAQAALVQVDRVDPGSRLVIREGRPFPGKSAFPDAEGQQWVAVEIENMCAWNRQRLSSEGMPDALSSR
jgi:hypothetical protein